jgi:hypothetical protein
MWTAHYGRAFQAGLREAAHDHLLRDASRHANAFTRMQGIASRWAASAAFDLRARPVGSLD